MRRPEDARTARGQYGGEHGAAFHQHADGDHGVLVAEGFGDVLYLDEIRGVHATRSCQQRKEASSFLKKEAKNF
jgi:hypothetical protein